MAQPLKTRRPQPGSWLWIILIILALPCVIQWLLSKVYAGDRVLNHFRFVQLIEEARQLDDTTSALAAGMLMDDHDGPRELYLNQRERLQGVLTDIAASPFGAQYDELIERVVEANAIKRQCELQLVMRGAPWPALLSPPLMNIAFAFGRGPTMKTEFGHAGSGSVGLQRQLRQLIGHVEASAGRSLRKIQLVTATLQYTVLSLAFVLFGYWRQHVRYAEEEARQLQHQEELEKAKLAAEDANRIKSEFLANMSHEMRTPLTVIMGMTHLCRSTSKDPENSSRLEKVETAATNLLKIVNDVLDISKLEAGKLELEQIPFHISDVLTQVQEVIGFAAREKDLHLSVSAPAECPPVKGDPFRLQQVLVNLASNAIKFTEQGQVKIKACPLTVQPADSRGHDELVVVRFTVSDTGIGLNESQIERIFEMFSQADGSTSRRYGGTGLGLFICHKIVDAMNGSIEVNSQPGRGSCFAFEVELEYAEDRAADTVTDLGNKDRVRRVTEQKLLQCSLEGETKLSPRAESEPDLRSPDQRTIDQIDYLESLVDESIGGAAEQLPEDIRHRLIELDRLLDDFDARSVDVFHELVACLDEAQYEEIRPVSHAIRQFDFAEAKLRLGEFCEALADWPPTNSAVM